MTTKPSLWSRLRDAWRYLAAIEPARVQVIAAAAVAFLASLGVTLPDWLPARLDAAIVAFFFLIAAVVGAERTRNRVSPTTGASTESQAARAPISPPPVGQDVGWSGEPSTGGDNGGVFPPQ